MIREGVYEGNTEFLDSVYLPGAAHLVKVFYDGLVEDEFSVEKTSILVQRLATSLATPDDFTSRGALMDAVEHGLHVIWLNIDSEDKQLASKIADCWALTVPYDMVVETNGIYSLNRECVPPAIIGRRAA